MTTFKGGIMSKFSINFIIPISPFIHCFPLFHSNCYRMLRNSKTTVWSHLLKKTLMENFTFCEVMVQNEFKKLPELRHCLIYLLLAMNISFRSIYLKFFIKSSHNSYEMRWAIWYHLHQLNNVKTPMQECHF